jgi:two-component system, NtrC family, nitrogen regulation response regulator NtrX
MTRILLIDDEKNIRRSIKMILEGEGYACNEASDGKEALSQFDELMPDLVVLDLLLPGMDGLQVLAEIKKRCGRTVVIMISGHGTVQNAMEAVRLGAYDFMEKPVTKEKLLIAVQRGLENLSLQKENLALRQQVDDRNRMIGISPALQRVREQINRVAPTNGRVLITGESGVGKELAARAIHEGSAQKNGPFIKVNCAAIPEDLIEAELFGSEKGAFTGSVSRTDGKFLLADNGTLFLDEVADMSLKAQAKVLRVLQEGEFERVGGHVTVKVAVRIISASNKNLEQEVEAGRFRQDLWYRLNVAPIPMPSLRQRKEDIPLLVEHFISRYCSTNGFRVKKLDDRVVEQMQKMDWPGNIRELQNLCERLVIFSGEERITEKDLPLIVRTGNPIAVSAFDAQLTLKELKEKTEKDYILWHLQRTDWNITKSAEALGIERSNLHKKMAAYKIERPDRVT